MASRPSAFDALMSGARAAAAAKKKISESEKRKAPDSEASSPDKGGWVAKKKIVCGVEESTAEEELKGKIGQLKMRANDFEPELVACWKQGERVPFLFPCLAFHLIETEKIKSQTLITDIVCNMLRTVMYTTPDDLLPLVYLLAKRIAPPHEGLELGIGEALVIKALSDACGRTQTQLRKLNETLGDLGAVAMSSRSSQTMLRKPRPLTITEVFSTFHRIAKESGKDSQMKKLNHIKALFVAATDCEPQYLIRLLQAKLGIGLAEKTLLAALGQAALYSGKHFTPPNIQTPLEEAAEIVKEVYSVFPVYDKIVAALLSDGVWNLPKTCSFTLGVPVVPMLAKQAKGFSEIVQKFQNTEFTCEYKYDGERAQIHYMEDGSVEIYSRNAERNTGKFPDVVAAVSRLRKSSVRSFVLDCELVAYDRSKQKILPFQILSTRARHSVAMSDIKVAVCIFAFDLLYLNGRPLIQEELKVRRHSLYQSFDEEAGFLKFATAITSNDIYEIRKFFDAAVDGSCEGLIIKTLNKDATYEPCKRSLNWLKLKKDYLNSIGDSLDLVPIAAFYGCGNRKGTGFSTAMLKERSASLRSKVIPRPRSYYRYAGTKTPDVWFDQPTEVWEVKASDLTISVVHCAAIDIIDPHKGISLRNPRFVRVRTDKKPEEASSSEQVAEMYISQSHFPSKSNNQDDNDDIEDDRVTEFS
ncbi:DNA ligase, ATP-dependent [Trema orientale]|uniref:DNA ligase n=1 Tax=Trema orientale TaxID=63057 RepID=A0A2P5EVN1_TREOI|nr:DNA ligase, ATP-dependent [Trema orientale]